MKKITFADYTVFLEDDWSSLHAFMHSSSYTEIFVLVDENTKEHCLPIIEKEIGKVRIIEIKSGERNKNIASCERIWSQLLEFKADRNTLLINLGGGVIGDMGGFAASCYKRGIDFVHIPTTLLAQVDASIGGKLGIDFNNGKNLIGLFCSPKAVFINTGFLQTLPPRQLRNGWAEIFKHALISDRQQWQRIKDGPLDRADIQAIIYHSLSLKKDIVEQDPKEQGLRKILNFGHTIGHALETYALQEGDDLLHGEAVAIGMIAEAYLSVKKCRLASNELEEIQDVLLKSFPKKDISSYSLEKLLKIIGADKKNRGDTYMAALLTCIGKAEYDKVLSNEDIMEALQYYIAL